MKKIGNQVGQGSAHW